MRFRDMRYGLLVSALLVSSSGRAQTPPASTGKIAAQTPTVIVPSVVGKSVESASGIITQVGLRPVVLPNGKTSGKIARQVPTAGQRAFVTARVTLYVDTTAASTAPTDDVFSVVPNVVGQPVSIALVILRSNSLVGVVSPPAPQDLKTAVVTAQSVEANSHVNTGTRVALTATVVDPMATVPTVIGMSVADSRRLIEDAGLGIVSRRAPSATVAVGLVIDQKPEGGTRVAKQSRVAVTYSAGPPPVTVPDLRNNTREDAEKLLTATGLTVGEVDSVSSSDGFGKVIWQNPAADAVVSRGRAVGFHIGRRDPNAAVIVPNLIGLTVDRATRVLTPSLSWHLVDSVPDAAPPSTIVRQNPVAGDSAKPGSDVHVWTARPIAPPAPDSVDVPELAGLTRDQASARVRDSRLTLGPELAAQPGPAGRVTSQEPEAGARDTVGAVVRFGIAAADTVPRTRVPLVTALRLDSALRVLRVAQLAGVASTKVTKGEREHWVVVGQSPIEGAVVRIGSVVGLSVEHSPERVTVPNVVLQREDSARTLVGVGGLQLNVERRRYALHFFETVLEQRPRAGAVIARGGVVNVDLSRPLTWPLTLATLPLLGYGLTKTPLPDLIRRLFVKVPLTFVVHTDGLEATAPVVEPPLTRDLVSVEITLEFVFVSSSSDVDAPTGSIILDGGNRHA